MKIITEYSNTTQVDVIEIKTAVYIGNFTIEIHFNDGKIQIVDFEPFLNYVIHPSIRQYLNEAKFKQFSIIDGNLNWNDYELIFPLEDLYNGKIS
jgi:hypothetical protein